MNQAYFSKDEGVGDADYSQAPSHFKRRKNAIEAVRISYENVKSISKWCGGEVNRNNVQDKYVADHENALLMVPTLNGTISVFRGEWLVKDEDGRYSVMDNKAFITEYEYDKDRKVTTLPHSHISGARDGGS